MDGTPFGGNEAYVEPLLLEGDLEDIPIVAHQESEKGIGGTSEIVTGK